MKKAILGITFLCSVILLFSCQKENLERSAIPAGQFLPGSDALKSPQTGRAVEGCAPTTVTLIAGQTINSGTVSVQNDANYIYVKYTTANGWYLTQTHLYVGDCEMVPVNNSGNPVPGHFPYSSNHNNLTEYTYQMPISALAGIGNCGCIAAHAVVVRLGATGNVIEQQTGWGNGIRINPNGNNWGMKFNYCICFFGV